MCPSLHLVRFAVFSVIVAEVIAPSRCNRSRLQAYECGIDAMRTGQRFPINYYLTAMLFIVFGIEIVFLCPWAVALDRLGAFGLVEMALSMLTMFVAYPYVWRRGGLNWD